MKKIIKDVDSKKGIIQVTIADERWYWRTTKSKDTLKSIDEFVPSVTWISSHYPKGVGFYKWLANLGWDEAEAIKQAAGDKGSKVHYAITDLLNGKTVTMDSKYVNPSTEKEEELTLEEYECLLSFVNAWNELKPETIVNETVVFEDKLGYAGTVDWIGRIGGELYILDFKTAASIWPEYKLQLSAYKEALKTSNLKGVAAKDLESAKMAILQIGYRYNKNQWKLTEIEDKFELFLAAKKIWEEENKNVQPSRKDYPLELKVVETKESKTK